MVVGNGYGTKGEFSVLCSFIKIGDSRAYWYTDENE